MAKTQVSDWDTTAANNTDLNSIPIDGAVTAPSQVDNLFREMMAQLKTFSTTVTISVGVSVDNTIPRFNGVAGALQGSGVTIADTNAVTVTGTIAGALLTLESTDASANPAADIILYHNSASPAAADVLSRIYWQGKDSGGNVETYGYISGVANDVTNGSEDFQFDFTTIVAGSRTARASIAQGLFMAGTTDPGGGKINATGFQKAGVEFGNDVADQVVTGGARITSLSLGTITTGTVTPDPGDRPMQHYTNGGAHTLAPGSNNGFYTLDITNNGSAGAITTSGWTKVDGSFTTTNGHKFRCGCSIGDAGSLLTIQAFQ